MKPVVLIILDGWGYSPEKRGNAVSAANTPTIDQIDKDFPSGLLQSSGIAVGLPWAEPGNSEVGHTSIGTGQIRLQPMARIGKSIHDKTFFKNAILKEATEHTKRFSSSLHLLGLLGTGSVHSYLDHLSALLELAQKENVQNIFLHLFLDGRDSPPEEGAHLIKELLEKLKNIKGAQLASIVGRRYAMNRNLRWERTEKAYRLITEGKGEVSEDILESIKNKYNQGISDEFIEPIVVGGKPIQENDAVIFFNFRGDSTRQLSYAFLKPEKISGFAPKTFKNLFFVTMTDYEKGLSKKVAFRQQPIKHILSEIISAADKKQFKVAETEKYAHITYFFNGGREKPFSGETRKLVYSAEVGGFAEAPEMKAEEIGEELKKAIALGEYDFLLANFANADMLAHTGDLKATIKGIETIDKILGDLLKIVMDKDGALIISADHGNAEQMLDARTGKLLTAHSQNPVPFYLVANKFKEKKIDSAVQKEPIGILQDIMATILDLLDLPIPPDIDGQSLLKNIQ